ncbi:uncharacterized protein BJ171DRAFT_507223 [Polychytrium aggregatum]|uniref:uncharacterized protein n=1 Tax=Polychytrium aggregatum TaxID=110093 RepID=UPI0022FF2D26|nr:uncharacterized protein BJ171DRAFT_507223 [Polychytrium aggregatum]KAI9203975.1 hypothetical protein BJ171DRAFT_507223 [Polychytrium aggregatum]
MLVEAGVYEVVGCAAGISAVPGLDPSSKHAPLPTGRRSSSTNDFSRTGQGSASPSTRRLEKNLSELTIISDTGGPGVVPARPGMLAGRPMVQARQPDRHIHNQHTNVGTRNNSDGDVYQQPLPELPRAHRPLTSRPSSSPTQTQDRQSKCSSRLANATGKSSSGVPSPNPLQLSNEELQASIQAMLQLLATLPQRYVKYNSVLSRRIHDAVGQVESMQTLIFGHETDADLDRPMYTPGAQPGKDDKVDALDSYYADQMEMEDDPVDAGRASSSSSSNCSGRNDPGSTPGHNNRMHAHQRDSAGIDTGDVRVNDPRPSHVVGSSPGRNPKSIRLSRQQRYFLSLKILRLLKDCWDAVWIRFSPATRIFHLTDFESLDRVEAAEHVLNRLHLWRRTLDLAKWKELSKSSALEHLWNTTLIARRRRSFVPASVFVDRASMPPSSRRRSTGSWADSIAGNASLDKRSRPDTAAGLQLGLERILHTQNHAPFPAKVVAAGIYHSGAAPLASFLPPTPSDDAMHIHRPLDPSRADSLDRTLDFALDDLGLGLELGLGPEQKQEPGRRPRTAPANDPVSEYQLLSEFRIRFISQMTARRLYRDDDLVDLMNELALEHKRALAQSHPSQIYPGRLIVSSILSEFQLGLDHQHLHMYSRGSLAAAEPDESQTGSDRPVTAAISSQADMPPLSL